MAYCAQSDVQQAAGGAKRLKQLTDWDNNAAEDPQVIIDAIAAADALIDSFASKRFSVPFNPVPPIVKLVSAELAMLTLARNRTGFDDRMQKRWDELAGTEKGREGWLFQLATGVVTPGGDPLPAKHSTMAPDSVELTLPADRDISRDKTGGFW